MEQTFKLSHFNGLLIVEYQNAKTSAYEFYDFAAKRSYDSQKGPEILAMLFERGPSGYEFREGRKA